MATIKSIFDLDEFKGYRQAYRSRQSRFQRNWQYYKAEGYDSPHVQTPMGQFVISRITDAVRPLFTPLARAVNLDVSLIPGGWTLSPASAALQPAVDIIFRESSWPVEGDMFTKYVAAMGEAALYVSDDRDAKRITMQALRPDSYLIVPTGRYNPTPRLAIILSTNASNDEEATIIDPANIRTFVNGLPMGVDGRAPAYANALGYVPLVECKNDPGDGVGEPTFDDVIASLDQVNIQATHLANIIQKHVEPQWAAFGAEAGDLEKSGDLVWFFPEGSDVKAILAAVDFEGVLKFIQEVKAEVKEGLPELSLSKLVGVERVAAATIELQMAEAVFKIRRMRKPIDLAVANALRLVGRAAREMGLPQLAALDDPALELNPDRAVITLDALTRLQIEAAENNTALSQMARERERLLIAGQQGLETV